MTPTAGERRVYIIVVMSSLLPLLAACSGFSLPSVPFLSSAPATPNQSANSSPANPPVAPTSAPATEQSALDSSKSLAYAQKANVLHPPSTYTASAPPYTPPAAATPSPISDSKQSIFDLFSNKSNNQ
jgi:hypothetical protein